MSGPSDTSQIEQLLNSGKLRAEHIVAILGKTEGNGCVNDFTRGYAVQSLKSLLATRLASEEINKIPMVMSGGTEGGLSPHWIVFSETAILHDLTDCQANEAALAFASVVTRPLLPSEIGRQLQVNLVRDAVYEGMKRADITDVSDVHYVQVKCPLLTSERIAQVNGDVCTTDTLKSMGLSRGASALGVAVALNEIGPVCGEVIGRDWSHWSARASASAGVELMTCEVVVMGESNQWQGDFRIAHTVMKDAIDAPSVYELLKTSTKSDSLQSQPTGIIAMLAKAEASTSGTIRGSRHTMLDDCDVSSTRHARGFVGGMLSGLTGHTEIFVSGGAEHQGPDGGGPVAIIYRR